MLLGNFVRGLLGVLTVTVMMVLAVGLGWAGGRWLAGALGVSPTVPVIGCMVTALLALGLWLEASRGLRWFSSRD